MVLGQPTLQIDLSKDVELDYMRARQYFAEFNITDSYSKGHSENLTLEVTWVNKPPVITLTELNCTIDEMSVS